MCFWIIGVAIEEELLKSNYYYFLFLLCIIRDRRMCTMSLGIVIVRYANIVVKSTCYHNLCCWHT
jgi:hypothetical protein